MNSKYRIPDWAKSSFDVRFHQHIRAINQLPEVSAARLRQITKQGEMQEILPEGIYAQFLEYEGAINERTSLEHQRLYWIGIRDGLRLSEAYRACTETKEPE